MDAVSIVEIPHERVNGARIIEIVPSSYIIDNECYWRSTEKSHFLKQGKPYNPKWSRYQCKIKRTFATYEEASNFLRKHHELMSSSDENVCNINNNYNVNDVAYTELGPTTSAGVRAPLNGYQTAEELPPRRNDKADDCNCKCENAMPRLEAKLDMLLDLFQQQRQVARIANETSMLPNFPLRTKECVASFEDVLTDGDAENQFYQFCKTFKSKRADLTVRNILKQVLANELASHYTWTGYGDKSQMQNLKFVHLLLKAVDELFKNGNQENTATLRDWLRNAASRSKIAAEKQK